MSLIVAKLDEVEKRYLEIQTLLSDPNVFERPDEMRRLAKERAELEELVRQHRLYQQKSQELADNKQLLNEADTEIRALAKEEIARLEAELLRLEENLKILLLPKDPNDGKNIYLEIRAGTGGDEATLFAANLLRMYTRYADTRRWRTEIISANPTGVGGFKEVIIQISGDGVFGDLKCESGVHRVQRVPKTEAQGRVHTSAVSVVVMPEAEDVDIHIDEKDLEFDVFRASGPGGQSVNTTDSAVRITHRPTGLVVVCREEKSQHKNKARAIKLLQSRLYDMEMQRRKTAADATRKSSIGSGDRSEKIRTYNFPQNRITDHRIGLTLHQLDQVIEGKLDELITGLRMYYQAEALQGHL